MLDRLGSSVARAWAVLSSAIRGLSPKARLALSLAGLASVMLGFSAFVFLPSATLQLVCRHGFRSAEITVQVDGEVVHTAALTGAVRKWLGVLEKTEGTYAAALPVSAGHHVIVVNVRAPGFDSTRTIQGDLTRGQESVLSVDAGRGLSLAWRGKGSEANDARLGSPSSPWFRYAGSIMMTIFGSIVSASIGVLVQDFLRSRKARLEGTGDFRARPPKVAP